MDRSDLHVILGFRAQIERRVNLRLRIILNSLLADAMKMTRSCNRAVDMLCGVDKKGGAVFLKDKRIDYRAMRAGPSFFFRERGRAV